MSHPARSRHLLQAVIAFAIGASDLGASLGASLATRSSKAIMYLASPWRGESLVGATGVVTLKVTATASGQWDITSMPLKLYLRRQNSNSFVVIPYRFPSGFSRTLPMWKVPAGRYTLVKVVAGDGSGRRWSWQALSRGSSGRTIKGKKNRVNGRGKKPLRVLVGAGMLATLGQWRAAALGRGRLGFGLASSAPAGVTARNRGKLSNLRGMMNGLTGKVYFRRKLARSSAGQTRGRKKVLGVFSRTERIGVYYGLALANHKRYTKTMTTLLRRNDLAFRNCYMKALRFNPSVRGRLMYRFRVSPKDRLVEPALVRGGTIKDKRLLRCLYYEISSLKVPIKLPVQGSIAFKFMTTHGR